MADNNTSKPANNMNFVYLAAFSAALVTLVIHASETNAFSQPSTFVGIVVGLAVGAAAWIIGRRKH